MQERFIVRASQSRQLPLPTAELYQRSDHAQAAGPWATLAASCAPPRFPLWLRLGGWSRRPEDMVRHLVYLHRCGFEAELAGRMVRADFYWRDSAARLGSLWTKGAYWEDAARALQLQAGMDGPGLRRMIAEELFVDTHIAFANGAIASGEVRLTPRVPTHARLVEQILALGKGDDPAAEALRYSLLHAEIAALEKTGREAEAIKRIRGLKNPALRTRLAEQLATLVFRLALRSLDGPALVTHQLKAARLRGAINEMDQIRRDNPNELGVYELTAHLQHALSVQLANDGTIADALVACESALDYWPRLEAADETRTTLVDRMKQRQHHMSEVERQLRGAGDMILNAEGERMRADAQRGFTPLLEYRKSTRPATLAAGRESAARGSVWNDLAAPGTASGTRPPDDDLNALNASVGELYASDLHSEQELAQAFAAMQREQAALRDFDPARVAGFILERRRHNESIAANSPPHTSGAAGMLLRPGQPARDYFPPLLAWLFGRQDKEPRALLGGALLFTVLVGAVSVQELAGRRVRDEAVARIRQPGATNETIIREAERFLQARTLNWNDPREEEVHDAYAAAFTNWFVNTEAPTSAAARQRIGQYKKLVSEG